MAGGVFDFVVFGCIATLVGASLYAPHRHSMALAIGAMLVLLAVSLSKYLDGVVAASVVPLGLGFYGLQYASLLLDVRSGAVRRPSPRVLVLYGLFFPQLIAGPIVRPAHLIPQLEVLGNAYKQPPQALLVAGLLLFFVGVLKKQFFAPALFGFYDVLLPHAVWMTAEPGSMAILQFCGGLFIYGVALYFDFSAYADFAIGTAALFGVALPVNFWKPYHARSMSEFWRRWHITLGDWLKHYCYKPMLRRRINRLFALLIAFVVIGLWHGVGWQFAAFGLIHGVAVVIERVLSGGFPAFGRKGGQPPLRWMAVLVQRAYVAAVFSFSMAFFIPDSIADSLRLLAAVDWAQFFPVSGDIYVGHLGLNHYVLAVSLTGLFVLYCMPNVYSVLGMRRADNIVLFAPSEARIAWFNSIVNRRRLAQLCVGLAVFVALLLVGGAAPYVYFRF